MTDTADPNLTPSELNRQVRTLLESHYGFVWVTGEVSNFAAPSSGHWYFTLKDDQAQVRCAMFRNRNQRLRFRPSSGDAVRLRARVSLYEGRGEFQLIGEFLEPAGAGALQARFEALRDRLRDEGLFAAERKQPLPPSVTHIAVITSPTGAALQDILTVLRRRDPLLQISVFPAAVQGDGAAAELVSAIEHANAFDAKDGGIDVILLARGGGSLEDLWAFNDETLARAIAASRLPIVSGVGHEVDVTIADFAADVRAPTPSAAAELVSRDLTSVLQSLHRQRQRLRELMQQRLKRARETLLQRRALLRHPGARLRELAQRLDDRELRLRSVITQRIAREQHRLSLTRLQLAGASPEHRLREARRQLSAAREGLHTAISEQLGNERHRLAVRSGALETLNPLAILQRGYAIITTGSGSIVRRSDAVAEGEQLRARLGQGNLTLTVVGRDLAEDPGSPSETGDA